MWVASIVGQKHYAQAAMKKGPDSHVHGMLLGPAALYSQPVLFSAGNLGMQNAVLYRAHEEVPRAVVAPYVPFQEEGSSAQVGSEGIGTCSGFCFPAGEGYAQ